MNMDLINQWLAQMEVAPIVGALIIAGATIIAAGVVRFLGHKVALALSRWSGLGIRSQLFEIIRRPLWVSVILVGTLSEVKWLALPPPADFVILAATLTGLAIVWTIVVGKTLRLACSRLTGYYPAAEELFRLSENIGTAIIGVMGGLIVLSIWQINLTPLLASAGLVGIIVGLAAKDTLGNFFGGISVFLDRPFRRGDYIVLNSGERGKVIDIGLRSTRIITRDDVLISVPNSMMVNTKVVNESAPSRRMRVRVKISTAYTSNVHRVKEVLLKVAHENPLVLREPEPRVRFRSFGDSGLNFELLCWTGNPGDKGRLIDELNSAVFEEFNHTGIVFPVPQRDVFVHRSPDNVSQQTV
jgi:MscS family membrane protein